MPEIEYMISYWKELKLNSELTYFMKLNEHVLSGLIINNIDLKHLFAFQNSLLKSISNILTVDSFCLDHFGYFIFKIEFKAINKGIIKLNSININSNDCFKLLKIEVLDSNEKINVKLNKFGEINLVDSKENDLKQLEFTYYLKKDESFKLYIVNEPLYYRTNLLMN